jgi:hypothetical protein
MTREEASFVQQVTLCAVLLAQRLVTTNTFTMCAVVG